MRLTVCGTHGKTTTSALLVHILDRAGMDPGFRLGSTSLDLGGTSRLGSGPFVFEGDEYTSAPWDPAPEVPAHAAQRRMRDAPRARSSRRLREPRRVPRAVCRAGLDHAGRTACSRSAPMIPNAWRFATVQPVLSVTYGTKPASDWSDRRARASEDGMQHFPVERRGSGTARCRAHVSRHPQRAERLRGAHPRGVCRGRHGGRSRCVRRLPRAGAPFPDPR